MSLHETFLANVKRRMKELGLSQRGLAERLGVSEATVSQLLAGHWSPSLRKVEEISEALKTTGLYLQTPVEPEKMPDIAETRGDLS